MWNGTPFSVYALADQVFMDGVRPLRPLETVASRGRISCNEDRAHRRHPPRNAARRRRRPRAGCPDQGRARAHGRQGRHARERRHPRPGRPHRRRRQQPHRARRRNDRRGERAAGDAGPLRRPHADRPRGSEPGGVHLRRRAETHGARVAAHVAAGIRRHARLQCALDPPAGCTHRGRHLGRDRAASRRTASSSARARP